MRHRLIDLPVRRDERGSLAFAQLGDHIPFAVKRVFYLYDIPRGSARAGHAHRAQHQLLIMLNGRCCVALDDGATRMKLDLCSPEVALYVPPLIWLDLDGFSEASICLVLTSDLYQPSDYVRDRAEFEQLVAQGTAPVD